MANVGPVLYVENFFVAAKGLLLAGIVSAIAFVDIIIAESSTPARNAPRFRKNRLAGMVESPPDDDSGNCPRQVCQQ